jgi:hypothetical protein
MSSVAARIAAAQAERDLSEAPVDIFHAFDLPSDNQQDWSREQDEIEEEDVGEPGTGRISMYVRIVNEMFETVLNGEEYLFTEHEQAVLNKFLELECESRCTSCSRILIQAHPCLRRAEISLDKATAAENQQDLLAQRALCTIFVRARRRQRRRAHGHSDFTTDVPGKATMSTNTFITCWFQSTKC